jgi:LAO/AO transport system kinase
MTRHYNQPGVYIRSLATRGSLGGLHPEITGISTLLAAAGFDYLLVETVGVGQSEVEIASLADTTIVVFVPSSGDEVQAMKAGLMEIADIFVVNKADQAGAALFVKNLRETARRTSPGWEVPVLKTDALTGEGIGEVLEAIEAHASILEERPAAAALLASRAYGLIQARRMKDVNLGWLQQEIENALKKGDFNLYRFVRHHEGGKS